MTQLTEKEYDTEFSNWILEMNSNKEDDTFFDNIDEFEEKTSKEDDDVYRPLFGGELDELFDEVLFVEA